VKRTARERIERAFHVSFKLPGQAAALLDDYRDEVRAQQAAELVAVIRALPVPKGAGRHWHWYAFALNRAADHLEQHAKEQQ
jgi:hypothetical protein